MSLRSWQEHVEPHAATARYVDPTFVGPSARRAQESKEEEYLGGFYSRSSSAVPFSAEISFSEEALFHRSLNRCRWAITSFISESRAVGL
jgi:hypothetical protein